MQKLTFSVYTSIGVYSIFAIGWGIQIEMSFSSLALQYIFAFIISAQVTGLYLGFHLNTKKGKHVQFVIKKKTCTFAVHEPLRSDCLDSSYTVQPNMMCTAQVLLLGLAL